ncbi:MAG: hypothetical protein HOQ46_02755 [Saccharothrix sp.]|nr:hypothetical protein [Saccharothrix sp.]
MVVVAFLVPVLGLPGGARSPVEPGLGGYVGDFDPMRRVVAVADVPGVTPESYTTARRWQQIGLKVGESGFGSVTVYARGRQATGSRGFMRPETGTPAEPIGGRPAFWVSRGADDLLAWEWTGGAWAFVTHQDPANGGEADRDTMRRIASAVRVGGDDSVGEPVTLPFTLPLPEPYQMVGTTTRLRPPGDPFVRTGVLLATGDPTDPDIARSGLSVAVENGDKMARQNGANQTVDGRPAMVHEGEAIIFAVADGFAVDVQGTDDTAALLRVARTVRLVPAPSDKSTWTSRPLT